MNEVITQLQSRSRRAVTCASALLVLLAAYGQVVTVSAEESVTTQTDGAAFTSKARVQPAPEFAEAHVNQDVIPASHVNQDSGEGEDPPEANKGRPQRRLSPDPGDVWINVVPCPGDIDGDGVIAFEDMFQILSSWGHCEDCPADVDEDGNVNLEDLSVILNGWGQCIS